MNKKTEKTQSTKNINEVETELALYHYDGDSPDVFELVNEYGTYEVQKTPDTNNRFASTLYVNSENHKRRKGR